MLEDIINNRNNSEKFIRSYFWPEKTGKFARFREVSEWLWFSKILPVLSKVLAIGFIICSVLVLLGEASLYTNTNVSLFPYFFQKDYGIIGTQILCLFTMGYVFSTVYIGIFTLRVEGSYGLYNKNHTDPANLV